MHLLALLVAVALSYLIGVLTGKLVKSSQQEERRESYIATLLEQEKACQEANIRCELYRVEITKMNKALLKRKKGLAIARWHRDAARQLLVIEKEANHKLHQELLALKGELTPGPALKTNGTASVTVE